MMKRKRGVQVCFICIQSAQRRDFSFFRFVKIFYSFKKQLWSVLFCSPDVQQKEFCRHSPGFTLAEKGAAPHPFRLPHEEICTKIQKNDKKNVILQSL